jgi:predicted nucleic acid-binding protein
LRTALDSSVLLDVIVGDDRFAEPSERALRRAMAEGSLVVCECVLSEIRPAFGPGEIESFLSDLSIDFVPSTRESALLAGEMFRRYLERRRRRAGKAIAPRVVPDFLIGAHATVIADRLLARDRGYYRDYFVNLNVLGP